MCTQLFDFRKFSCSNKRKNGLQNSKFNKATTYLLVKLRYKEFYFQKSIDIRKKKTSHMMCECLFAPDTFLCRCLGKCYKKKERTKTNYIFYLYICTKLRKPEKI